jgi:hypothetical protein
MLRDEALPEILAAGHQEHRGRHGEDVRREGESPGDQGWHLGLDTNMKLLFHLAT